MKDNKIRVSIQEIVCDFERMIRHHERLDVLFDLERAEKSDIDEFYGHMARLARKYLPNYMEHVSDEYLMNDTPAFDKALELYGILYENYQQMFYQLV
jgi:hypothetical protein